MGFAADFDVVASDDQLFHEEAQVALRECVVALEQKPAERHLEALEGGLGEQVRRRLAQGDGGCGLRLEVGLLGLQLSQAGQSDVCGCGVGLEGFLPLRDASVDVGELAGDGLALLRALAAEYAGVFHNVAHQLAAALEAEEVIGEMLQHGSIEFLHREAMATASLAACSQERAAVVIAVRVVAVGVPLAAGLEDVGGAAVTALHQTSEQKRARCRATGHALRVTFATERLRRIEERLIDDGLNRNLHPLRRITRSVVARLRFSPEERTDCGRVADHAQHEVLRPELASVSQTACVQLARGRFCAGLLDVEPEDLA